MTTTLNIDEDLLKEAMKVRRTRKRDQVVREALEEYIGRHKRLKITRWFGKVDFVPGYDAKETRRKQTTKVLRDT
jgi:metal-responsive CopG/Arc/MetJ family transcriptional regulator